MPKKLKKETRIHKFIKEHFMVIVVLAITLIPSIYTVLFLGSMWDPYGNTGSLPVAIVNEDEAVIYGGKEVNIGEILCDNLKKNKQLQFNFVDEQVALDGLENGTYYMVLVVPKNFSYNSTTLTSSNPQKMVLDYYVNPGTNYIASKFGESGVKSIKESINKSVINTYATTVYSKLNTIGDGFTMAADGSGQIYDGVGQLRGGNSQITGGLKTLSNGCLTLRKGTGTLEDGLRTYTNGVSQVDDGVKQLHDGVPLLNDGISQLQNGAAQLQGGTFQIKDGTFQLKEGASQLKDGTSQLVANNDALNDGAQQLLDGLNTMSAQLGTSLSEENLSDLQRLEDGLLQINDGIQTLQKAVNEDYKISDETIASIKSTIADVETFTKSDEFRIMSTVISTSTIDWTRIDNLCNTLEQLPLSESNLEAVQKLRSLSQTMQKLQGLGSKITPENAENLVEKANSLIDAYYQLSNGIQQLSDGGNQALPVASDTLKTLTNGLLSIQNGLDRTVEKDGETGLIEGMTTLKNGIEQYTDGVTQVDSGAGQLKSGSEQLNTGAIQLDDGALQLKDGLSQLGDGFGTAGAGINKLYGGIQQLVANNDKINSGASQLNGGALQLYDGSLKLYDGTLQIDEGCEKLLFGANTLKESLEDGAAQIAETNTGESAAEMFAQPVEANETFQRTINTNGEAMSAYMMCAGLWVACLAFCLMFSPFKTSLGTRKTFIGHALIAMFVSMVQAPIMVTLLMAINGMRPQNVGLTYLMAILASMAFMSIVYYLNTLLDSIGSFCLLILLCLQLSGAAGTYPIELSPKFYQIIHPFMPFAYGVDAFRSTLSTGNPLTKDIIVFVCIIAGGIIATCLTYEFRRVKLKRKEQTQHAELTEQAA